MSVNFPLFLILSSERRRRKKLREIITPLILNLNTYSYSFINATENGKKKNRQKKDDQFFEQKKVDKLYEVGAFCKNIFIQICVSEKLIN